MAAVLMVVCVCVCYLGYPLDKGHLRISSLRNGCLCSTQSKLGYYRRLFLTVLNSPQRYCCEVERPSGTLPVGFVLGELTISWIVYKR